MPSVVVDGGLAAGRATVAGMSADDEGQVSEVQQMPDGEADTPISDDQAVAGPAGRGVG